MTEVPASADKIMDIQHKKTSRNSLIELYRFLFALWVIQRVLEFYWQPDKYVFFIILVAISVVSRIIEILISKKKT